MLYKYLTIINAASRSSHRQKLVQDDITNKADINRYRTIRKPIIIGPNKNRR